MNESITKIWKVVVEISHSHSDGNGESCRETKTRYFDDDEEIYPHAWGSCVTFYKLYHGQRGGLIEADPNHGERITITFKEENNDNESRN